MDGWMDGWKSQKSDSRDARELDAPTDIDRSNRRCVTRRLDPRVDLKKKIYSRCDGKISFSTDVIGSWSGRSMGRVVIRNLKVKRVGRRVPRPSSSHRIATHLTHLIHPRQCATSCACRSGRSGRSAGGERRRRRRGVDRTGPDGDRRAGRRGRHHAKPLRCERRRGGARRRRRG